MVKILIAHTVRHKVLPLRPTVPNRVAQKLRNRFFAGASEDNAIMNTLMDAA